MLPPACARCQGDVGPAALCAACAAALPRLPRGDCPRCGAAPGSARGGPYSACAGRRSPLDACVAESPYEGEIERFVHRFKYPRAGLLGLDPAPEALLVELLVAAAARLPGPAPAAVVPVPQHARGLRRRGFNPAANLAQGLCRALALPFAAGSIVRVRDGPSQTGLDRAARRRNVAGAFLAPARVAAHIWLVDDVVTTGATLEAAARALRRAGARRIAAVCAARTPRPGVRSGSR